MKTVPMKPASVVIGANGGIGRAVTQALAAHCPEQTIFALSRSQHDQPGANNIEQEKVDTDYDTSVENWVKGKQQQGYVFSHAICCTGQLHPKKGAYPVSPEKKLEDISPDNFLAYFEANTLVPALWIKHLCSAMMSTNAYIVVLSARVGSISDNRLGGWYGYRASKAALNMIVKTAQVEYARRSPNTILVSYHPGTVDTGLSVPFQSSVKPEKLFTPAYTANQLLLHLPSLERQNAPYFIDWAGETVDW